MMRRSPTVADFAFNSFPPPHASAGFPRRAVKDCRYVCTAGDDGAGEAKSSPRDVPRLLVLVSK